MSYAGIDERLGIGILQRKPSGDDEVVLRLGPVGNVTIEHAITFLDLIARTGVLHIVAHKSAEAQGARALEFKIVPEAGLRKAASIHDGKPC